MGSQSPLEIQKQGRRSSQTGRKKNQVQGYEDMGHRNLQSLPGPQFQAQQDLHTPQGWPWLASSGRGSSSALSGSRQCL